MERTDTSCADPSFSFFYMFLSFFVVSALPSYTHMSLNLSLCIKPILINNTGYTGNCAQTSRIYQPSGSWQQQQNLQLTVCSVHFQMLWPMCEREGDRVRVSCLRWTVGECHKWSFRQMAKWRRRRRQRCSWIIQILNCIYANSMRMLADFRHWLSRNGGVTSISSSSGTLHPIPGTLYPGNPADAPTGSRHPSAASGDAFATKCPQKLRVFH